MNGYSLVDVSMESKLVRISREGMIYRRVVKSMAS